ncbi:MAG TPA: FMN-binding negative transcriptional regulator [Ilumatobacteraceae bacterium]|nr:FMN-binding negative transcriptional regulator [Ilumatobacteraceae bacterium]
MYRPAAFDVADRDELFDLIERAAFGHLVTIGPSGFDATGLPFMVDRDAGPSGRLTGHVARANSQWRDIAGASALVLFPLTDAYVSPSSYPTKAEHGKVVPTWNYEVVHVHGTVRIHEDPDSLRELVTGLTDQHEAARSVESPWAVADAPGDFIDKQLRAIVGIEVQIESIEGKRKLSQNRSEADRLGAAAALASSPRRRDQAVAEAMGRLSDPAS